MRIFAIGPSSSPCSSFFMLFIHSSFLLWSLRPKFWSKIVLLSSYSIIGKFSHLFLLIDDGIFFRYLVMICLYCLILSRYYLVFLLSPVSSNLCPRVASFVLTVLFFSFRSNIFHRVVPVLVFLLSVLDILFVFLL